MNIDVKISVKPIEYIKSVNILEKRVTNVLEGKKDELLWILEHNPVYTAGTSSKQSDLLDKDLNVIIKGHSEYENLNDMIEAIFCDNLKSTYGVN